MPDDDEDSLSNQFDPDARPRGILTKQDRRYLLNQDEYDTQASRDKRYRIRNRVRNGLRDFPFLMMLPDDDRSKVFQRIETEEAYPSPTFHNSLRFLYSGISATDMAFDEVLSSAIKSEETLAHPDKIPRIDVYVSVEYEEGNTEQVINRLTSREGTWDDMSYLLRQQQLDRLLEELDDDQSEIELDAPPPLASERKTVPIELLETLRDSHAEDEN